jgi:hypothetical protein
MSGPKALSIRRAMSGVSDALPRRRSDRVARLTFRITAAFSTRAAQKRAENLAGHARPLQSNSLVGVGHARPISQTYE